MGQVNLVLGFPKGGEAKEYLLQSGLVHSMRDYRTIFSPQKM